MSVNNTQEIAKTAAARELLESPAWNEIVLKAAKAAVVDSFKHLTYGTIDFADAQRYRGIIAAMKALIQPVYQQAEEPLPVDLKSFFDP